VATLGPGIDLFNPEEERKRQARMSKYGDALIGLSKDEVEAKKKQDAERAEFQAGRDK